ncbi:methyltransferase domain-containing protein [Alicyclobacillus acidocaldarius]|uniref:Methyltransferase type 11 n=1 Tax=Alicyclobacillus acidocaldarius subsp. acidocaldarius (strain ATCC 27009 / DSM 446 / BCRC 14685 / JCM 5260 / KCTC 1825 / NBRC 15652 / NCIMB 11725 / NRRL B-14509 / 104-IA) TaxID=521098 RepID=C8WT47_ALIAD|nr:methyltransferase domain-containing protein [Alicyclobacillus acidocaldarius]ACV59562.1 Methyltransferase type 11 [Alicyclobacillus acidocaldarius subsp. acidocaldarius DSM 446]
MDRSLDRLQIVDDVMQAFADREDITDKWLIRQTIATAAMRRAILATLPMRPGMHIVDVGCGYGALLFDIAAMHSVHVTGIDHSPAALAVDEEILSTLAARGALKDGASITLQRGDAMALPLPDGFADGVVSRFLFQHIPNSRTAAAEMFRILRSEGFVCAIDSDDALSIEYPADPPAVTRAKDALKSLQRAKGGVREVGRQLASIFHDAGFSITQTFVVPQAVYSLAPSDLARDILAEQLQAGRQELVARGILTKPEYLELLRDLRQEEARWQFSMHAEIAVIAQKPS